MPKTLRDVDVEIIRRVLTYHQGAVCVGTFGDECLCGWRGESWNAHVAPLIADALHAPPYSSEALCTCKSGLLDPCPAHLPWDHGSMPGRP